VLTTREIVEDLAAQRRDQVVIATMSAGLHWLEVSDHDLDIVYNAPMGSCAAVGLGLALARPDIKVIVLDGDGALLMNLGALVTMAGPQPANLAHVVFSNGGYAMTGGQPHPGPSSLDWAAIGRSMGLSRCFTVESLGQWHDVRPLVMATLGHVFVSVKVDITSARPSLAEIGSKDPARKHHTFAGYWRTADCLADRPPGAINSSETNR
jgi:sulfopyruvate decarboxylase subunit beta